MNQLATTNSYHSDDENDSCANNQRVTQKLKVIETPDKYKQKISQKSEMNQGDKWVTNTVKVTQTQYPDSNGQNYKYTVSYKSTYE